MAKMGNRSGIYYQPPGSSKWHRHESAEEREEKRRLLRRARSLLKQADERVLLLKRRESRQKEDLLAFEREMAAALGARERWVQAGVKEIFHRSKRVTEEAALDAWEVVKRTFRIRE
jgi:hypothetical protein